MHPKDRPVIVLSTGRAGSTLLQKLLNTHPALVIWGEHAGILRQLMMAWKVVFKSEWIPDQVPRGEWLLQPDRPLNADRWTAWDGSFSKQGFSRNMKQFVDSLFCEDIPEQTRWGFKEIRYLQIELMDFIAELYPHAQFILLLRNPIDSCVSFTAALAPKKSALPEDYQEVLSNIVNKQIKPVSCFFADAMEHYPENARVVLFEQLVENPGKVLGDLTGFLGLSPGFEDSAVAEIMRNDIVSERRRTSDEKKSMLRNMAMPLLREQIEWYERIASSLRSRDQG